MPLSDRPMHDAAWPRAPYRLPRALSLLAAARAPAGAPLVATPPRAWGGLDDLAIAGMKFGHTLRAAQWGPWEDLYIPYKALKKTLKAGTSDAGSYADAEGAFMTRLLKAVSSVDSFFTSQVLMLTERTAALQRTAEPDGGGGASDTSETSAAAGDGGSDTSGTSTGGGEGGEGGEGEGRHLPYGTLLVRVVRVK